MNVTLDPTAGETARRIRELPTWAQPILDPTDPRYGLTVPEQVDSGLERRRSSANAGEREG